MKRIFLLITSVVFLCSVSIAGGNFNTIVYTPPVPKKEIKKENKIKKSKKRLGEKSRVVALILCLFLGWFAVHRWYLGTSDRSGFLLSLLYLVLAFFLYIHVILDFFCILFGKMDFYLDNPGVFIWATIFFK
jgi:hypothetical protein